MNLINIAWKQVKHDIRDMRSFLFMLAFPIVLMVILGSALSNVFNNEIELGEINVLYKNSAGSEFGEAFSNFARETAKSGIHFREVDDAEKGRHEADAGKVDAFAEIRMDGIELKTERPDSMEAGVIEGLLHSFAGHYKTGRVISQSAQMEGKQAISPAPIAHDYIKETSVSRNRQPGSMDYYAIVMTTMITLYSAIAASYLVTSERALHTAERLLVAPVRKHEIFIGKVAGSILINALFVAVVVAFSALVLKVDWGAHWFMIAALLLTEVMAAVSLGLGLSLIMKTPAASRAILMVIIQIASFFGGAYFKIENPEGVQKILTNLSPLTWENKAAVNLIYTGDFALTTRVIMMNIGVALLFMLISGVALRRREGL